MTRHSVLAISLIADGKSPMRPWKSLEGLRNTIGQEICAKLTLSPIVFLKISLLLSRSLIPPHEGAAALTRESQDVITVSLPHIE